MVRSFFRLAILAAAPCLVLCLTTATIAQAQRTSTFEEDAAYRFAEGDRLGEAKLSSPQECRDRCIADRACGAWLYASGINQCLMMRRTAARETREAPKETDILKIRWYTGRIETAAASSTPSEPAAPPSAASTAPAPCADISEIANVMAAGDATPLTVAPTERVGWFYSRIVVGGFHGKECFIRKRSSGRWVFDCYRENMTPVSSRAMARSLEQMLRKCGWYRGKVTEGAGICLRSPKVDATAHIIGQKDIDHKDDHRWVAGIRIVSTDDGFCE